MASSRLRNLVPVNAVLAEDASAGAGTNGSASSSATVSPASEDEGVGILKVDCFFLYSFFFVMCL